MLPTYIVPHLETIGPMQFSQKKIEKKLANFIEKESIMNPFGMINAESAAIQKGIIQDLDEFEYLWQRMID
jgi:cell division ATPase FtsA